MACGDALAGRYVLLQSVSAPESCLWLQGMLRNPAEEDIRASILRHADKEGDQFSTFTKAYAKTQPERILAEEEKEEEGSDKEG